MNADRKRWEARYRHGEGIIPPPAGVLADNAHLLPERGRALDLACGRGGNALFLARRGLAVTAWDFAPAALAPLAEGAAAEGLELTAQARDVLAEPPPAGAFEVIVVANFLDRALAPALAGALAPGGVLFYETFAREGLAEGGPSNPDFLLRPGELLTLFAGLRPLVYRDEGRVGDASRGLRGRARLVALKP